jgi:hypothetical protein
VAEGKASAEEIPALPLPEKHHVRHPAKKVSARQKPAAKEKTAAD